MSGKMVGMVFDHYPKGGAELLLAVRLADSADHDGTRIWPSVRTLAAHTRQSERAVQYQLRRMMDMGWLVLVREGSGGGRGGARGRSREYRIAPDWVRAHDSTIPAEQRGTWKPRCADAAPVDNPDEKEMGANLAPNKNGKRVQKTKEMGATAGSEMGATAGAPYLSGTSVEQIPPNPPAGGARGFDHFIEAWPAGKRTKLVRARRLFDDIVASGVASADELVAAVATQADVQQWAGDGAKRVPAPDRWLREQRWHDGMAASAGQGAPAWTDSRAGVEAMGARLGLGSWDAEAFSAGRGEAWPVYRARVVAAAGAPPLRRAA